MKRTVWSLLVFALACLVWAPAVPADSRDDGRDDPAFSVRDIRGPYGFSFDGFAGTLPAAAVGRFTSDGRGNITRGVRTIVVAGLAVSQTFTCEYSVNRDGTGEATCTVMTDTTPITETFDFAIVKDGEEVHFIETTAGITARGTAKRQ